MTDTRQHWQSRLDHLARRHQVPGASLAVWAAGELTEAATGVLNVNTQVPATTDSVFQIGSITKPYTTTLVMQLVEEGRLDPDEPVVRVLPGLRLGDEDATARVTMRHLLSHTSGIEGDFFDDFGRGDDVLRRYVDACATLGFSHPVGATMSYCNTGFGIAGRVLEVLTGQTWDAVLRERLVEPLGLRHTVTLPEEALRFRAAHGHLGDPGQAPHLAPVWGLPRSLGPAGLICATAADVVAFARLHLDGGRARDGTVVLAPQQVEAMQSAQVAVPDQWTLGAHWGLGWILFDWDGRRVYGHDGGTLGQSAFLRVVPDSDVVVALLTNGGQPRELYLDLFGELLAQLCDLRLPPPLEPAATPPSIRADDFAGRYERVGLRIDVTGEYGTLAARSTVTGPLAELVDDPVEELVLRPVTDRVFVTRSEGQRTWTPVVFYEIADGTPYLHMGARATPKLTVRSPGPE